MESRTVVLFAVAAVFSLMGLVLRALPSRVEPPALPPVVAVSPTPDTLPAPLAKGDLARANPFSPVRAAPAVRYAPRGAATRRPQPAPGQGLRLVGTLQTPSGTVALIDADPAAPGAEMYRVGDQVGDSRLISVDESSVVLQGPLGRRVLRLP
jgi:hypothetical protein